MVSLMWWNIKQKVSIQIHRYRRQVGRFQRDSECGEDERVKGVKYMIMNEN